LGVVDATADSNHSNSRDPATMGVTFNDQGGVIKIDRFSKKTIDPYKKNVVRAVKSIEPDIIETSDIYKEVQLHIEGVRKKESKAQARASMKQFKGSKNSPARE